MSGREQATGCENFPIWSPRLHLLHIVSARDQETKVKDIITKHLWHNQLFDHASLSKSARVLPCRGKGVSAGGGGVVTGAVGGEKDVRDGGSIQCGGNVCIFLGFGYVFPPLLH